MSDLREHCYVLHTWMMGAKADENIRFQEEEKINPLNVESSVKNDGGI